MIIGPSPYLESGYSTVTRNVASILDNMGEEVLIAATAGITRKHGLNWNGIPVVPTSSGGIDGEYLKQTYKKFNCNLVLCVQDIWPYPFLPKFLPLTAYVPNDHEPVPEGLRNILRDCKTVIPHTKWAEKLFTDARITCESAIPHGVDTSVFQKMDKTEAKLSLKQDTFLIGLVGANADTETRKRWDKNFEAIKLFKEAHPDAKFKLYIHTEMNCPMGVNLYSMAKFFGLQNDIIYPDQYEHLLGGEYPNKFVKIYNAFDVYMNLSSRESFGLCALEASACGTPSIQTDFSAMTDLTIEELRVPVSCKIMTHQAAWTAIPDAKKAAALLGKLYENTNFRKDCGEKCFKLAQGYDWKKNIAPLWEAFIRR